MNGVMQQVKLAEQIQAYQYSGSIGVEIENDDLGNLVLLTFISGNIKIDTMIINHPPSYYAIKLDSSLNLIWKKYIVDNTSDVDNLRINSAGNIIFLENSSWHYLDIGAIKEISKDGLLKQTILAEGTGHVSGMDMDSLDNIYFTGIREKWTYSGNPPRVFYFKIGMLNKAGNLIWLLQDSSLSFREGNGIAALSNSTCFISGRFSDNIVLYNSWNGMPPVNSFLAILDVNTMTLINELNDMQDNVAVYPNPTTGVVHFRLQGNLFASQICVYDLLGNCLVKENYLSDVDQKIDLSRQSKGIYLMEIISDGRKTVKKIVVQ